MYVKLEKPLYSGEYTAVRYGSEIYLIRNEDDSLLQDEPWLESAWDIAEEVVKSNNINGHPLMGILNEREKENVKKLVNSFLSSQN